MAAFKPVVTGLDEPANGWPRDHELLADAASAGQRAEEVSPYRFGPPVSPHYAAELAGSSVDPVALLRLAREAASRADLLVVEGVGGLLVPLTPGYLVRDLAVDLALPVVVSARPGVGTISHTLLTVEAARAAGLVVAAVVITPWQEKPSGIESSNRATIERLSGVVVHGLPTSTPETLATAGRKLPLQGWLDGPSAAGRTVAPSRRIDRC